MSDSIQHKLKKVRPPRVKITYDVEVQGSVEKQELPFVIGVIGDFAGDNKESATMNNNFVVVDPDNIDQYMSHICPSISYSVPKIGKENEKIAISLVFQSRADFEVYSIIQRVPELKQLYEELEVLKEISVMIDANDNLKEILEKIIIDQNSINKLKEDIEEAIKPKNEV